MFYDLKKMFFLKLKWNTIKCMPFKPQYRKVCIALYDQS